MRFFKFNAKAQVVLLILVWIALGAGDWFFRFYWFGWQRSWWRRPVAQTAGRPLDSAVSVSESDTIVTTDVPSVCGGDLTRLIQIPSYVQLFEEERPAFQSVTDSDGFYSPYAVTQYCPVVVVGDSFMQAGGGWTNTFPGSLASRLAVPVRNRGVAGKGAVMPLVEYLDSWQFKNNPPAYLVYGLLEREMTQYMLAGGMVFQLWQDEHGETGNVERVSGRIRWGALSPSVLKKQLPDTSVIAKLGEDLWNVLRYCVFGEINPDIVVSLHDGMQDSAMLFYRETIDLMRLDAQERGVDQVIWALEYLNDYLDRHGVRLVLVLIPDKAQVYRQWLPEHLVATKDLPVSSLWSVADSLRAKDVPVINLLGPYRQVANQEELIYWRDDTHWNAKGIKMAADLTANEILRVDKGKNFE